MKNNYYNFSYTSLQEAPIPRSIIIWNFLDFGHVNFVHKKCYKYCRVLAKYGNVTLLEYGANQFLNRFIPFTVKHVMWHQYVPPDTIMHLSKSQFGTYMKVVAKVSEFMKDGKPHSRIEHKFYFRLPFFLRPLKWLIKGYMEKWSDILWQEDLAMCARRQKALDNKLKDSPLDTLPRAEQGLLVD